jgi:hypothetical protein
MSPMKRGEVWWVNFEPAMGVNLWIQAPGWIM